MKLDENPQLPALDQGSQERLISALSDILRAHAQAVNEMAGGRIDGFSDARTAPPTTGRFRNGDFVPNSVIVEQGLPGMKYVLDGWVALGGSPGVFLERRSLTGN